MCCKGSLPVCLHEVSCAEDFDEYIGNVSFDELRADISRTYDLLWSPRVVTVLRGARADELAERVRAHADEPEYDPLADPEKLKTGDMVFENMALLLRDALIAREFTDAIKGGYSGRIDVYKAQGSNASWHWLKIVSPCISLFRKIALQINARFGARLGNKHSTPGLERDMASLQSSMRANTVFQKTPGRILRGVKNGEVPNVIAAGLKQLHGPLAEYNKMFSRLQRRRRETPLGPLEVAPSAAPAVDAAQSAQPVPEIPDATVTVPSDTSLSGELPEGRSQPAVVGESTMDADLEEPDEEDYWRAFEDDDYEPYLMFAEEETIPLDICDY
ncbi:hypothetical protein K466DRAFT_562741 [Polyporus arcularius HHB13444]|uniref:DUF6589 domain-containing protein n=1 Tax=Polyporus arcularius HHB13444 TaxID=1314778 RepID=A0A5C3PT07_9APHY|nr:hypothetical protein K466DRAFT_562741 [Polyporus arcularius HHB13444]